MDKLVVTVAVTGNVPTKERTPYVPVTPEEIAQSAFESYQAGAALVHVHARDEAGRPTHRTDVFREIVGCIREKSDQCNFNPPDLIEYLCKRMKDFAVVPEIEVFDAAMLWNGMYENLPQGCTWQVSAIGPMHVPLSMMAIALGGHVRTGLEDNIYYARGVLATNPRLVERIAGISRAAGREIATPDEARGILGLPARK